MATQVTFLAEEWTQSAKGGALSTLTRQLAIYLAQRPNLKVSLLIPKCSPEDKQDAGKYNIKVFEPEEQPGLKPVYWLGFPPEGFSTDFIIGHDVKLGWQGNAIKRRYGCKWIHVVHSNAEEMGMCKNLPGAISVAQKEHEDQVKLCEKADMVITIGPKLEDSLSSSLRFSGKEIFNLTPGIFDEFCNVRKHFQARKTRTLLIFGRGDDEDFKLKGFDVAAKAVGFLDDSTYHLMVVGAPDGRQEELATKLCSHGIPRSQLIVRCFYKDRKQLANFLSEADLLLMPSGTEAFGLVALEALSADLPILVTSNSGLAEALRKVPLGSQCIVDSEEDWAKKIKEAWKGIKVQQDEAKCLRERYKEKYSWEKQCDTLVKKMQSMLPDVASDTKKSLNKDGSSSSAQKRCKDAGGDTKKSLNKDGSSSSAQKRRKENTLEDSRAAKRQKASHVDPEEERVNSSGSDDDDVDDDDDDDDDENNVEDDDGDDDDDNNDKDDDDDYNMEDDDGDDDDEAVRDGTPSYNELSRLAHEIPSEWKNLGGLLGISNARITAFERQNQYDIFEQAYKMLQHWKQSKARRATYKVLFDALSDELVDRGDLAVKYCCKKK